MAGLYRMAEQMHVREMQAAMQALRRTEDALAMQAAVHGDATAEILRGLSDGDSAGRLGGEAVQAGCLLHIVRLSEALGVEKRRVDDARAGLVASRVETRQMETIGMHLRAEATRCGAQQLQRDADDRYGALMGSGLNENDAEQKMNES